MVPKPIATRLVIKGMLVLLSMTTACKQSDRAEERAAEALEVIDRPPAPSFAEPVNYVAWVSDRLYEKDWPCGEDIYSLLYDPEVKALVELEKELSGALRAGSSGPWSPQEMPELAQYLRTLDPYLQAYAHGAETNDVRWFCRAETLWGGPFPDHNSSSKLAKALLANAWMEISSQDLDPTKLTAAIRTNLRHARHIGKAGGTIALIYNMSIRSVTYEAIQHAFDTGILSNGNASVVVHLLDAHDDSVDFADAFRRDWAGLLDLIQQLYPMGRFSDSAAKALGAGRYLPPGGVFLPRPEKTAAQIDEWFGPMVRAAELPLSTAVYRDLVKHGEQRDEVVGRNLLLRVYLPSNMRAYLLGVGIETKRRGTMIFVTLHAYKNEHDRWPRSLDEVGALSPTMRIDPFSEREFRYELRDGQPWLYSAGLDGEDNGGNYHPKAATSDRREGHDLVFLPIQKDP